MNFLISTAVEQCVVALKLYNTLCVTCMMTMNFRIYGAEQLLYTQKTSRTVPGRIGLHLENKTWGCVLSYVMLL